MMFKEIIFSAKEEESKLAVLEDNVPMEIYIERSLKQRLTGNIYIGRVENVLPGMQAAFVNIGLDRNAFLYIEDALPVKCQDDSNRCEELAKLHINDFLKVGQELLVQVAKEPIGTKGPRVTTHITLPGRYLVLMPMVNYIGISRRIEAEGERERLKDLGARVKPEGMGVIMRTMAVGVEEGELRQDMKIINELWRKIYQRAATSTAPSLVHRDLELVQRALRDMLTDEVDRFTISTADEYEKVLDMLDITGPHLKARVYLKESEDIFEDYGLDHEIEQALKGKVWLKSGGYLVIDQAEALTAIDVNTGKYVGSTNLEATVLKTNLEAAKEIARQIRLRNLGGIIIVDFIDMLLEEHQLEVLHTLEEEIKKDKTKTNVLGLTKLGLVEMTRKKVYPSLAEVLQKPCPYCEGRGKILSEVTLGIALKNQIIHLARQTDAEAILVEANPLVAARLIGCGGAGLKELEELSHKSLYINGFDDFHLETMTITPIHNRAEGFMQTQPVQRGEILEVLIEESHVANDKDGIARINGFILHVEGAGTLIGQVIRVEIDRVFRTYAKTKMV